MGDLSDQIERPGTTDDVSGEFTCAWRNINGVAVVSLRVSSVGSSTLDEEIARVGLAGDRYVVVDGVGDEAVAVFRGRSSAGQGERLDRVLARRGTDVVELRLPGLDIASEADPAFAAASSTTGQLSPASSSTRGHPAPDGGQRTRAWSSGSCVVGVEVLDVGLRGPQSP